MDLITWATSPWGRSVPIHIAWYLAWLAVIAGLLFVIVHALYVAIVAGPKVFEKKEPVAAESKIPERVPRHSLAARLFHWIMAVSMFTLLFTAFLPKAGVQFNWVLYHWMPCAGPFASWANRRPRRPGSPSTRWKTSSITW